MKVHALRLIGTLLFFIYTPFSMTYAQKLDPYNTEWQLVRKHLDAGLPQSALEVVTKIYTRAKKEGQKDQQIKALIYRIDLQNENTENNDAKAFFALEAELSNSQQPERSILTSLLAKKYWNYYQQIRWQLYDRSETISFDKKDVATWSIDDFHRKIGGLYLESIADDDLLKVTSLNGYEAIIQRGNTRTLRPTLYDLLTHEALQYFKSGERDLRKPAYAFEISSASAMDPAADFAFRKFETKDSSSLQFYALQLYQRLIAFHLTDNQPEALLDVDLERLQFVREHSVHPDKENQYFLAINHIAHQYLSTPAAAQAWYLLAEWHLQRGSQYRAGKDSTYRLEINRAEKIAMQVVEDNPKTEGGINAWNLLQNIQKKTFGFSTENVNVPLQPFRMLVEYKNISELHLRIYTQTPDFDLENAYRADSEFWKQVKKQKPLKSWKQALTDTKDHQQHRVEVKVDGLPIGAYIIVASTNAEFDGAHSAMAARKTHISNISFIQQNNDLFVLHRESGQPLTQAKVRVWQMAYNNGTGKPSPKEAAIYFSDSNGKLTMRPLEGRFQNNTSIEIGHQKDHLHLESPIRTYIHQDSDLHTAQRTTWLFMDRSLYRPGQTVYYKGIVAQGQRLFTDSEMELPLIMKGANGEEIERQQVRVNQYGSFSGKLQLPMGSLNGTFSVVVDGNSYFSIEVEEYKRPKFEVTIDTLQGTYKVDETVVVTGKALAYAGHPIDAGKVVYRVVRTERYLYPWMLSRWYPQQAPMEISHGEISTDQEGRFKINFEAIPDRNLSINSDPIFNYTLYVDVTDGSGETRSATQQVSIGYKSLLLDDGLKKEMELEALSKVKIRTENLNGAFVPATVQVKFSKLVPEPRLIRPRLWEAPDLFVMSKEEYVKLFPHDEYDQESDPENWKVESPLFEKQLNTAENELNDLTDPSLKSGYYKVELHARDGANQETKVIRYIHVTDKSQPDVTPQQYLLASGSEPIEPGERTDIKIATAADLLYVIRQQNQGLVKGANYDYPRFKKGLNLFEYTATEADRGGYSVSFSFVKHNRLFQFSETIKVPWTNKDLTIEYQTFRDKTLPGSTEQWKLKISGYKKELVAAEMLTSMYDASLDQFHPHAWAKPSIWPNARPFAAWDSGANFGMQQAAKSNPNHYQYKTISKAYDDLIDFQTEPIRLYRGRMRKNMSVEMTSGYGTVAEMSLANSPEVDANEMMVLDTIPDSSEGQPAPPSNLVRTNFNETAFFLPDLHTNEKGEITFSFTLPDALTRWKFQALAHSKDLSLGYSSKEIVTQKELMVQPNAPRFVRQGDRLVFSTKVVNMSNRTLEGTVLLSLRQTDNEEKLDMAFKNNQPKQTFSIEQGQSTTLFFPIEIPAHFSELLTWNVTATAGNYSDAEEQTLPVLSTRMLVTESMPLNMTGAGTKQIRFDKLINSASSRTLTHEAISVEYTSNPAWYAIQALPYLMENRYDCSEQTWNRYYANTLATSILQRSPRIIAVFQSWQKGDTATLMSNLLKNQELKSIILEETPWLMEAKTEARQKQNLALLFDLVKMRNELSNALDKLRQKQKESGGFSWFEGGMEDRYMTQYILTGIGHLQKAKAVQSNQSEGLDAIVSKALPYLDRLLQRDYEALIKDKMDLRKLSPGASILHYLYMRSFFTHIPIPRETEKAYNFFLDKAKSTWVDQSKYFQGLTALAMYRKGDSATAESILKSLRQTAVRNEELGMYWKNQQRGWWWYEAPIERQSLLIEAFQEIEGDSKTVNALKTWLLKNKQTNHWESSKATAEACYALLSQGSSWLDSDASVQIRLGDIKLAPSSTESGTGYFKEKIQGSAVKPEMGQINLQVKHANTEASAPSWGAVYWQYFQDMDQITFAHTPLQLSKQMFIERYTDRGPVLTPITENQEIKVGDKIKVRIVLQVDRDMEYVHMKDLRASALEPINVLSSYKYQGGLGYYESTKDASTNFFFSTLRKGTYVFEYPVQVTHSGEFNNGITSIQCMYAPEFTAHSEGIMLKIK
ncbi:alpha-2-macroglobulin family protein [Dyadobacter tibetensis]|uniref:alpha-2-macroglobulin family protein n=1 Tax=Dyadobacter tibetensis TaxID=1211851 RepID=UPI000694ED04|nr:alpha-2-macroglobulin family protein [Dyadobacter tibetensis]